MPSRITFQDEQGRELAEAFGDVPHQGHRVTLESVLLGGRRDYFVVSDDEEPPHWWFSDAGARAAVPHLVQRQVYVTVKPADAT